MINTETFALIGFLALICLGAIIIVNIMIFINTLFDAAQIIIKDNEEKKKKVK